MSIWVVVDVEADGPCPGLFSMVSFGAVALTEGLKDTFYGETAPITNNYIPEALKISGHTRIAHCSFEKPSIVMEKFSNWCEELKGKYGDRRLTFISDNPAFDFQFINYYFHLANLNNPFGYSARRIGDLYAGLQRDVFQASSWKRLRTTQHSHNPVDDAMGNAEALLKMKELGLNISVKGQNDGT